MAEEYDPNANALHIFIAASLWLAGAIGILIYQSYIWLRYGAWCDLTLDMISHAPHVDWLGVQRCLDYAFLAPLWIVIAVVASVAFSIPEVF